MPPGHAAGPVRVVATDVDGTLFNDNHEVSAANADVARAIVAANVPLVLCTGKVPGPWSERTVEGLGLRSCYAVYNNGGLIVGPGGEVVYEAALDATLVRFCVRLISWSAGLQSATCLPVCLCFTSVLNSTRGRSTKCSGCWSSWVGG